MAEANLLVEGELLSEDEAQDAKAAIVAVYGSQRRFADERDLQVDYLSRVLNRYRALNADQVRELRTLLRRVAVRFQRYDGAEGHLT
jgi:hypothetical protein